MADLRKLEKYEARHKGRGEEIIDLQQRLAAVERERDSHVRLIDEYRIDLRRLRDELHSRDATIAELQNEKVLIQACADANGSVMLELQRQCVDLKATITRLSGALKNIYDGPTDAQNKAWVADDDWWGNRANTGKTIYCWIAHHALGEGETIRDATIEKLKQEYTELQGLLIDCESEYKTTITRLEGALKQMDDAAEMLWTVVANTSGGDWTKQTSEWQEAAARWRDNYMQARRALGEKEGG